LFQEIRERRGKAYTVYSFLTSYLDAGYAGVYVGTSAEWAREVVEVICAELERVRRDGLGSAELARVKNQMKGNIVLGLETSDSRMSRIAKNEIYFGRDGPLEEVAAAVDAVTNDDVRRVAARLFQPGTLALTVLGDLKAHPLDDGVLAGGARGACRSPSSARRAAASRCPSPATFPRARAGWLFSRA